MDVKKSGRAFGACSIRNHDAAKCVIFNNSFAVCKRQQKSVNDGQLRELTFLK